MSRSERDAGCGMRVMRSSGERLSSIGSNPGSAVLYAHGGGMILSNVGIYDGPVARYVSGTGVPFLSVEYRYAPEFPAPTPVTDCYAAFSGWRPTPL